MTEQPSSLKLTYTCPHHPNELIIYLSTSYTAPSDLKCNICVVEFLAQRRDYVGTGPHGLTRQMPPWKGLRHIETFIAKYAKKTVETANPYVSKKGLEILKESEVNIEKYRVLIEEEKEMYSKACKDIIEEVTLYCLEKEKEVHENLNKQLHDYQQEIERVRNIAKNDKGNEVRDELVKQEVEKLISEVNTLTDVAEIGKFINNIVSEDSTTNKKPSKLQNYYQPKINCNSTKVTLMKRVKNELSRMTDASLVRLPILPQLKIVQNKHEEHKILPKDYFQKCCKFDNGNTVINLKQDGLGFRKNGKLNTMIKIHKYSDNMFLDIARSDNEFNSPFAGFDNIRLVPTQAIPALKLVKNLRNLRLGIKIFEAKDLLLKYLDNILCLCGSNLEYLSLKLKFKSIDSTEGIKFTKCIAKNIRKHCPKLKHLEILLQVNDLDFFEDFEKTIRKVFELNRINIDLIYDKWCMIRLEHGINKQVAVSKSVFIR